MLYTTFMFNSLSAEGCIKQRTMKILGYIIFSKCMVTYKNSNTFPIGTQVTAIIV